MDHIKKILHQDHIKQAIDTSFKEMLVTTVTTIPLKIQESIPKSPIIISTSDNKQCLTQYLYNESTTVTNLQRSITDDYCCNNFDSLHNSKVHPRSILSTLLIIITPPQDVYFTYHQNKLVLPAMGPCEFQFLMPQCWCQLDEE